MSAQIFAEVIKHAGKERKCNFNVACPIIAILLILPSQGRSYFDLSPDTWFLVGWADISVLVCVQLLQLLPGRAIGLCDPKNYF